MKPNDIAKLNELVDDAIEALMADLETGTHWGNNAAAEEFATKYARFNEAKNRLYAQCRWLQVQEDKKKPIYRVSYESLLGGAWAKSYAEFPGPDAAGQMMHFALKNPYFRNVLYEEINT